MGGDTEKSRSLSQMISANLIMESFSRLDKQMADAIEIGKNFDEDGNAGQRERGMAISLTAGNKQLNQQLIKYINLLTKALTEKYPYRPLIEKRKRQVLQAYNYAVGGHFSNWETLMQEMILKVIGKNALIESGNVIPKQLVKINDNLKQLEDRSI